MNRPTQLEEEIISHMDYDKLPFAPCEGKLILPASSPEAKKRELIRHLASEKYGDYLLVNN